MNKNIKLTELLNAKGDLVKGTELIAQAFKHLRRVGEAPIIGQQTFDDLEQALLEVESQIEKITFGKVGA